MAIKQARGVTIGKGTPHRLEGQNGDMTIRSSRKGLKLYVKESNKWHSIDLDINLRQIASTVQSLEKQVKKLSTKTNNTPVVDKILLRQSGGTAAVAIQNKSGLVALRNSVDSADAKFQSIGLDTGTDNSSGRGWGQFYYDSSAKTHITESRGLLIHSGLDSPDAANQSAVTLSSKGGDSLIALYDGGTPKFRIGYDHLKADGSTSDARFKIHNGASFDDDSIFNLDTSGIDIQGNITASGDLTVSGGDATIKAANDAAASLLLQADNSDDAGDDWKIIANADQTLTFGNDIASAGSYVSHLTVTPHATATSTVVSTAGSLKVGSNIIQASDGGSTITMDTSDNVTVGNNLACNEITAGAVVWESFPFVVTNGVAGRPYFRDVDDLYGDFRKWDDYDTSPTGMDRRKVAGQFVVPENCTLKGMQAVVLNTTSNQDIDIHIYTGTPNLNTAVNTTLALAGGAVTTVAISTANYSYSNSATYDVDLTAGDIIVPMVEHDSGIGNQTFRGNITLKLVTR